MVRKPTACRYFLLINRHFYRDRGTRHDSSNASSSSNRISIEKVTKSSDLSSYATEDEKIAAMVSQSTDDYDSSRFQRTRGHFGPLPMNYTCYRCGQGGHYIKNCPTNNVCVKTLICYCCFIKVNQRRWRLNGAREFLEVSCFRRPLIKKVLC